MEALLLWLVPLLKVLLWIVLAALVIYTICDAIVFIPAAHYGVVLRFGGQLKKARKEGLNLKIPFIDEIKKFSLELETKKDVRVEFTTKDNLRLVIPGSLQWRADENILNPEERNVFARVSEDAIRTGIDNDVRSKIAGVGGKYEAEIFKNNIQAISDLINSMLRLGIPLHLNHKQNDPALCGLQSCKFKDGEIDADELIDFYNQHWAKVKLLLDGEKKNLTDHSTIEERYGIDIEKFSLAQIDYTKETQAAMEEKKQADYRKAAGEMVIKLMRQVKKNFPELSEQQALNWSDSILNPGTPREMISIEGDALLGAFASFVRDKLPTKKGGK